MSPMQHKVPSDEEQEETARPEAGAAEKNRQGKGCGGAAAAQRSSNELR